MALIKHNTREGDRTTGHFAHDTTRRDRSGAPCNGRTDRVMTSRSNPCPQCGGWGELVEIDKLPRSTHPVGSEVTPANLASNWGSYVPGELAGTWEGGEGTDPEPVVTGSWNATTGDPVPVEPVPVFDPEPIIPVGQPNWDYDKGHAIDAVTNDPVPVDPKAADAGKAIADLLGIGNQIESAVNHAIATAKHDNQAMMAGAINLLKEEFDKAVSEIVAPKSFVIENRRTGAEPKTIVGAHKAFERCMKWLEARDRKGHTKNLFLVGPTGSGKTTLAMQLAEALDTQFYTTGQVLGEHQVTGFVDANGNYHETPYYYPFVNGGLWLGDEFDGWSPEAALAMNAGLANGMATFPNSVDPVLRHEDFYCIVAGNTWGKGADRDYVGRNQMDAASLRRYVKIFIDYDKDLETMIAGEYQEWLHLVWTCRDRARELKIKETFSTGEIEMGVDGLRAGMDMAEVTETILKRDISDDNWRKLAVVG